MDFGFSEAQELWRKAVRDFARREGPPEYARACDREGRPPTRVWAPSRAGAAIPIAALWAGKATEASEVWQ